jgi:hypothetical protein
MEACSRTLHPHPREEDLEHEGPAAAARAGRQAGASRCSSSPRTSRARRSRRSSSTSSAARSGRAVKAPGFGDRRKAMLEDIAILTGGQVITEDLGLKLENVTLKDLGRAKRVTIDKDNTTIVDGAGKKADIEAASSRSAPRSRRPPRLRPREAPGAPREARRRRRGDQGRRGDRDRDEGEEGPRRGRAARDPRGRRGGHRPRRRRRAAPRARRARQARRSKRRAADSASTSCAARSRSRCARSPANAGVEGSIVVEKVKRGQGRVRLQRRDRRVRGPGQGRRHRPDQGRAHRAAERGAVGGGPAAHHRGADRREAQRRGGGMGDMDF